MNAAEEQPKLRLRESILAVIYSTLLVWMNAYICREMFIRYTPRMNSMHGFWIAMSKLGSAGWFHSQWWRYWDCGAPGEFVYAPLVPASIRWIAALRGVPHDLAFQTVSAVIYCLGPVTLFLMAWLLTRAQGYSFAVAVFYSLAAPSQLLVPDGQFSIHHFWDSRRFYLMAVWDDTPHMAALAILPLVILFLARSIQTRNRLYNAAATLAIAVSALASDFGPIITAMASLCLLFVLRRRDFVHNLLLTAGIGLFAYAIASPFLSPTNIRAIHSATAGGDGDFWTMGSFTALAIVASGWALLWHYLPRWTPDWRLHFLALFTWLTGSIPLIAMHFGRRFLPQPARYTVEMDFSLALLIVFSLRPLFAKIPRPLQVCLWFLAVAIAAEQVAVVRKYAKEVLAPVDVTRTIEYRTSLWAHDHLPGVRVMLPGSIGQWANAFTDVEQLGGGSWSLAYNPVQQRAKSGIYNGGDTAEEDARVSILWLKAFGAGAIAVPGEKSQEFWKSYVHPAKFEGLLPALWSQDEVTIYQVPLRTNSYAHVVPESALVRSAPSSPRDTQMVEKYVAALEDPALPEAAFQWQDANRIHVRTVAAPGQAISIQVTHHPGWHAKVNGMSRDVKSDGLGLMWIAPGCTGPCDIQLEYTAGTELLICHVLSVAALVLLAIFFCWSAWARNSAQRT